MNSSSSNADRTFAFLRDLSFFPPNYVLIHLLLSLPFPLLHRRNHQPRKTQRGLLFCSDCQSPATFPSFDFHVFFLYRSARSPLNVACAHQCYGDDERVESTGQTDRQASVSVADTCQRCSLTDKGGKYSSILSLSAILQRACADASTEGISLFSAQQRRASSR